MITKTINIYNFLELPEDVQQQVIERNREEVVSGLIEFIGSEISVTADKIASMLDFKFRTHSHYSTFYYACSASSCEMGNRLYRKILSFYEYYCTQPKTYTLPSGKKRISKIFREQICCPFTGVYYDEYIVDFLKKWLSTPHILDNKGYEYEFVDFCDELMAILPPLYEQEADYAYSDEFVRENILSSEYGEEYLIDGSKYNI